MLEKLEDLVIRKSRKRKINPKIEAMLLKWASKSFSHYRSMKIHSYDEYDHAVNDMIYSDEKAVCYQIDENGSIREFSENIICPKIICRKLTDVQMSAGSSFFYSEDKAYTSSLNLDRISKLDIGFDRCLHRGNHIIIKKLPAEYVDECIYLSGEGAWNWYHWLLEILPKILLIDEEYKTLPIAVYERCYAVPSMKECLDYFARDRKIIVLEDGKEYNFKSVVLVDSPTYCLFDSAAGAWVDPSDYSIHKTAFLSVKEKMLNIASEINVGTFPNRFFLMRKNTSRKYNQDEILDIAKKYGFIPVYAEKYSVAEQAAMFRDAEYILGASGAAWANMIFSQNQAKALCWMLKEARATTVFANLAAASGVELRYLLIDQHIDDLRDVHFTEYSVDPDVFEGKLRDLISAA